MTLIPTNNVVLLLPMSGNGSTFIDFSSSPKDIQSFNAIQSSAQSKWGTKSGYFNGTNSYLSLSSSSSFNFAGDFTIETWVYPTALIAYCTILEGRSAIASENYICGLYNMGGQYRLDFLTNNVGSRLTGSSTVVPLNQWSHIAFVRSGNTIKAYVNGVMDTTTSNYTGVMNPRSSTLFIGKNVDGNYAPFYINDLRIINGVAIAEVPQTPLLDGGTTTTTTTAAPPCPCGSLYLPMGKAFSSSGLSVVITTTELDAITALELNFLHSEDIYLESGEKFATVTPIIRHHIIPNKLIISHALPISINNVIQVVVKDRLSKAILGTQYIGKYNEATIINNIVLDLHSSIDLYDNAIIVEMHSLCDNGSDPCCDKLPSEIDIVGPRLLCVPLGQYYVLPTTTTTTTPEPFVIEFLTHPTNQTVNAGTKATFSFSAITMYDKDFKYWWEKSTDNGSSWQKASRLLEGKSRNIHTLVVLATVPMNNTKYRVVTIEPKIKYSNIATLFVIAPPTTTTTTTTFTPATTTLPPCDMQIMGFDSSTTTTTTTTTITPAATTSTTTTTTTTSQPPIAILNQWPQGYTEYGYDINCTKFYGVDGQLPVSSEPIFNGPLPMTVSTSSTTPVNYQWYRTINTYSPANIPPGGNQFVLTTTGSDTQYELIDGATSSSYNPGWILELECRGGCGGPQTLSNQSNASKWFKCRVYNSSGEIFSEPVFAYDGCG